MIAVAGIVVYFFTITIQTNFMNATKPSKGALQKKTDKNKWQFSIPLKNNRTN
jgi:hypothetical protein